MKILFTGGGTGGHFYPIIAVSEEVTALVKEYRLIPPELYYMAPDAYNEGMLYDHNIVFKKTSAGKRRLYFSILNFFDFFKTVLGIFTSLIDLFMIYPDVVFGKGGYASFPVLFAARLLRIPVVIHESDAVPGRVNAWAGKFAEKIAVSFPEAAAFFPKGKVAYTGNPIRKEILEPLHEGAHEFLKLSRDFPTVLVLGGSQGSQIINEVLIDALPELIDKCQIIHQTGKSNWKDVTSRTDAALVNSKFRDNYKPFDYLNTLALRMSAGAADIVISRAGSAIFEISSWGIPSIIIPITDSHGDHQRKNAYAYARAKACIVLEEINLTPHILVSEITRLLERKDERDEMRKAAEAYSKKDAARAIAKEILAIALKHEL